MSYYGNRNGMEELKAEAIQTNVFLGLILEHLRTEAEPQINPKALEALKAVKPLVGKLLKNEEVFKGLQDKGLAIDPDAVRRDTEDDWTWWFDHSADERLQLIKQLRRAESVGTSTPNYYLTISEEIGNLKKSFFADGTNQAHAILALIDVVDRLEKRGQTVSFVPPLTTYIPPFTAPPYQPGTGTVPYPQPANLPIITCKTKTELDYPYGQSSLGKAVSDVPMHPLPIIACSIDDPTGTSQPLRESEYGLPTS